MKPSGPIFISVLVVISLCCFGIEETLSQPAVKEEKGPQIKLGEVTLQVREFKSAPSPVTLLEVQIEIHNQSPHSAVPPGSIKVAVVPKEIEYPGLGPKPAKDFSLYPEEVVLDTPLLPQTVRQLTVGFSLSKEKPESMTFEVHINPPEGEKKRVIWKGEGN